MKLIKLVLLCLPLLLAFKCGGRKQPPPRPIPQPTPTVTPTPTPEPTATPTPEPTATPTPAPTPPPRSSPTPHPVPSFNPSTYGPLPATGPTIPLALDGTKDIGPQITAAYNEVPEGGTLQLVGGGFLHTQTLLKRHTNFDAAEYDLNVPGITDYGQFLIADGVRVQGIAPVWDSKGQLLRDGTRILEPTGREGLWPVVITFQAKGDACCSHTERSQNISISGFHIIGRQTLYDGGVRSTINFGNCENCTIHDVYLDGTAAIGIVFGGSALEKGFRAKRNLAYNLLTRGLAAANVACVNCEDFILTKHQCYEPGHPPIGIGGFGGGVTCFDLESNSPADYAKDIYVFDNYYSFQNGAIDGIGSAIALQSPYAAEAPERTGNIVVVNNTVIGGIHEPPGVPIRRFLTSCFYATGVTRMTLAANYCFKTGQDGLQWYGGGPGSVVQDNYFEAVGGGGVACSIGLNDNVTGVLFRRNRFDPAWNSLPWSTCVGIVDRGVRKVDGKCTSSNTYEGNYSLSTPGWPGVPYCGPDDPVTQRPESRPKPR